MQNILYLNNQAMREIKFRAWDKNTDRMYYSLDAKNFDENSGREYFPFVFEIGYKGNRDFELMQFTGLKDKNGREVYEGDIIRWPHLKGSDIPVIVYFSDSEFVFAGKPKQDLLQLCIAITAVKLNNLKPG
jgi:uncharacterized phage protein (TIGR01671 family)